MGLTRARAPQITGGGLSSSEVVQGLVIKRDAEGTVKRMLNAKARPPALTRRIAALRHALTRVRATGGGVRVRD
jgi:hypothetical protein